MAGHQLPCHFFVRAPPPPTHRSATAVAYQRFPVCRLGAHLRHAFSSMSHPHPEDTSKSLELKKSRPQPRWFTGANRALPHATPL